MSSDELAQFARGIGWRDIADGADHLARFKHLYERRCSWRIMGYGPQACAATGERYLAAIRSFAERPAIWHVYERIQRRNDRSTYLVNYSPDGKAWQEIGSFDRWPRRWRKPEKNLIARLFSLYTKLRYRKQMKAIAEMQRSLEARAGRQEV